MLRTDKVINKLTDTVTELVVVEIDNSLLQ